MAMHILKSTRREAETVGYARVSSTDQHLARQIDALKGVPGIARIYSDKASGKDANRTGLQECLDYLTEGDTLAVASMDRLARSLPDLLAIVHGLAERGIGVKFLKEALTFDGSPNAELMLAVFGAVAQFERALIKERQAEGVRLAKEAGKYKGRAPKLTAEQQATVRQLHAEGVGVAEIGRRFNVSRQAVYRYLKAGA